MRVGGPAQAAGGRKNPWRQPDVAAYPLVMPFVDPNQPDQPLTPAEIRARIARGEADVGAGRVSDLDELLAEWEAEDGADRPGQCPSW